MSGNNNQNKPCRRDPADVALKARDPHETTGQNQREGNKESKHVKSSDGNREGD